MHHPHIYVIAGIILFAIVFPIVPVGAQQTVELVFSAETGKSVTVTVPTNTEKLHLSKKSFLQFGKHEITTVTGFEKLTQLKTVILSVVPMLRGFDFLSDAPQIKHLLIHTSSTRDLSFIEELPHL